MDDDAIEKIQARGGTLVFYVQLHEEDGRKTRGRYTCRACPPDHNDAIQFYLTKKDEGECLQAEHRGYIPMPLVLLLASMLFFFNTIGEGHMETSTTSKTCSPR